MGIELDRTASNLIELEPPKKLGNDRKNPTNYGQWSKSIELNQTLTPDFVGKRIQQNRAKDFEQKATKVTK